MAISLPQNFFQEKITLPVSAGATNIYISSAPTADSGILVLSPANPSKREIVRFTAKGTDSNGAFITVTVANRGLGGTTDQSHSIDEPIFMNVTAEHFAEIDTAIEAINTAGALDASATTKGIAKLSVAPTTATEPVAVGDNDPRIPDPNAIVFLSSITGMVIPYAGSSVPNGFFNCDGSLKNIEDEKRLFDAIGFTYGRDSGVIITADNTLNSFEEVNTTLENGDLVSFDSSQELPTGIVSGAAYYVIEKTTNTFKVATEDGGSEVAFTNNGTGVIYYFKSFSLPDLRGRTLVGEGGSDNIVTFNFENAETPPVRATLTYTDDADFFRATPVGNDFVTGESFIFATAANSFQADQRYYFREGGDFDRAYTSYNLAITGGSDVNLTDQNHNTPMYGEMQNIYIPAGVTGIETGDSCTLSTDGTLPATWVAGTHYVIVVDKYNIKLAESKEQALAGRAIPQRDNGTGTITLTFEAVQTKVLGNSYGKDFYEPVTAAINSGTPTANNVMSSESIALAQPSSVVKLIIKN
jgi:microcystin-dependent protein